VDTCRNVENDDSKSLLRVDYETPAIMPAIHGLLEAGAGCVIGHHEARELLASTPPSER